MCRVAPHTVGGKGYKFFNLPDLPPCSIETTTILDSLVAPKIGPLTRAGSDLTFTDANGHTWNLAPASCVTSRVPSRNAGLSASPTVKRDCP
jgi:hypothetical protein